MRPCVRTNGAAASTPGVRRTWPSTLCQSSSRSPSPYVRTRRWGLATRIFSRRSACRPFITPRTTTSAMTPTVTPPTAITVMRDSRRDERRLRKYRRVIRRSSGDGQLVTTTAIAARAATVNTTWRMVMEDEDEDEHEDEDENEDEDGG